MKASTQSAYFLLIIALASHHKLNYEDIINQNWNFMAYPIGLQCACVFPVSLRQIIGAAHACLVSCDSLEVCVGSLDAEGLGTAKAPHPSSLWVINVSKGPQNSSALLPYSLPSLFSLSTLPPFTLTLFLPPSLLCILTNKPRSLMQLRIISIQRSCVCHIPVIFHPDLFRESTETVK